MKFWVLQSKRGANFRRSLWIVNSLDSEYSGVFNFFSKNVLVKITGNM